MLRRRGAANVLGLGDPGNGRAGGERLRDPEQASLMVYSAGDGSVGSGGRLYGVLVRRLRDATASFSLRRFRNRERSCFGEWAS
jgi:hypothetical protein